MPIPSLTPPDPSLVTDERMLRQLRAARRPGKMRILISDDDPIFRAVLVKAFKKDGYDVSEAEDGNKLLDLSNQFLESGDATPLPDLILLDNLMPGLTGLEVLEKIAILALVRPVVFLSSFNSLTQRRKAMTLGATATLEKPLLVEELIESLQTVVHALAPVIPKVRKRR